MKNQLIFLPKLEGQREMTQNQVYGISNIGQGSESEMEMAENQAYGASIGEQGTEDKTEMMQNRAYGTSIAVHTQRKLMCCIKEKYSHWRIASHNCIV